MKPKRLISPKYIISVTIIFALVMVLTGALVIKRTSSSMIKAIEQEGVVLTEGLILSSQNILKAGSVIEPLFCQKLLDVARFISQDKKVPSMEKLAALSEEYSLTRIDIFDLKGKLLKSSLPFPPDTQVASLLQPIFSGIESEMPIGVVGDDFGVAVKRDKKIVVCYMNAEYINEFRKETGIGMLIQKTSEEKGIEYIALQDNNGIVFASENIHSMKSLDADSFLLNSLTKNIAASRVYDFTPASTKDKNYKVLEVVKPFVIDGQSFGIFRVGLSLAQYDEIVKENRKYIMLLVAVIFLLGTIVMNLVGLTQRFTVLDKSYKDIQTLTGSILESIGDAVVAVDSLHRITELNRSAENLFSVSRSSAIGKDYSSVFSYDECLLQLTLEQTRTIQEIRKTYKKLGGESRVLSINTNTIFSADKKTEGAVAVIRDVTELKKMEDTVKEKERLSALGELAAGVAHEIRNPLNAIGLTAQRIEQEFEPKERPQEFSDFIRIIKNEIVALNNTVEQFLSLARPMTLNCKPENINDVLEEVIALVDNPAKEKGIKVRKKFSVLPIVEIDSEKIKRAFLNIALNGIDAMKDGDELLFVTDKSTEENTLKIKVSDTGCGIPKEELPKIFIPYFTKKSKGTGLGLSITHQLITAHKGRIEVESVENVGTTFIITLPVKQ